LDIVLGEAGVADAQQIVMTIARGVEALTTSSFALRLYAPKKFVGWTREVSVR
jgi:hypothetical protein